MDESFTEKLTSLGSCTKGQDHDLSEFIVAFASDSNSLVSVSCGEKTIEYDLKPLQELYGPETAQPTAVKLTDSRYFEVLYAIEGAIKRLYQDMPDLTDSSVILVLEKMSAKPEFVDNSPVSRTIHQNLRLQLSMTDYSRNEVRQSIRQVLKSAKRHKGISGIRGYLDFIVQYVP